MAIRGPKILPRYNIQAPPPLSAPSHSFNANTSAQREQSKEILAVMSLSTMEKIFHRVVCQGLGRDTYLIIASSVATTLAVVALAKTIQPTPRKIIASPRTTVLPRISAEEQGELPYPPDIFPGARDVASPVRIPFFNHVSYLPSIYSRYEKPIFLTSNISTEQSEYMNGVQQRGEKCCSSMESARPAFPSAVSPTRSSPKAAE